MSDIDCVYLYLSLQESKIRIFQVAEVVLLKYMKVLGSTKICRYHEFSNSAGNTRKGACRQICSQVLLHII
jgi:hypothetical protein